MELSPAIAQQIAHIESIIRRDPGKRGLLRSHDIAIDDLGAGELASAAVSLNGATQVAILTGFFIPLRESGVRFQLAQSEFRKLEGYATKNSQPLPEAEGHAETDGPLGAAVLGRVLANCGIPVQVLTDPNCAPVVQAAFEATRDISFAADRPTDQPPNRIANCEVVVLGGPSDLPESYWDTEFGRNVSHILSIERVGPSFDANRWNPLIDGDVAQFASTVSPELQNRCFNMRGECIDDWSCGVHEVFETAPHQVSRIGIGDGGNELGLGKFGWETIAGRLGLRKADKSAVRNSDRRLIAARIPCRVSADHTVLAGVSNWGADALAAVFCLLRDDCRQLAPFDQNAIERILLEMVHKGGALDGVTKLREPTVDGLPFITYIQPWNAIRSIVLG